MFPLPFQENQENATNLVISDTELKQVAYVFKCTNSTLQIKGKINSITLGEWGKLCKLLLPAGVCAGAKASKMLVP